MSDPALLIGLTLAVMLVSGSAVAAFTSANALKKLAAVLTALAGAALALALLRAPGLAAIAAMAVAFGYLLVGVAIVVRLHEAYGTVESDDIDAADQGDEPREAAP